MWLATVPSLRTSRSAIAAFDKPSASSMAMWEVVVAVERVDATSTCPRCNAGAPRLYGLPEKLLKSLAAPRTACYFCYVRIVGIKPTRRKIVS